MPRIRLTKAAIDALPTCKSDVVYWDAGSPGFGVKVTPKGRKVFIVLYRTAGAGSKLRKYTIGSYGRVTLHQARVAAQKVFAAKLEGRDPAAEKRAAFESLGIFAASFEDMSITSPTWRTLGQVLLVYFAVGGAAVTAQDTQPGRTTFAEMIAFARLASVPCQRLAPDADSFRALALRRLIQPPITKEEIAAKEKDIKRLRIRLGLSRWCKRYAGQMEQARILVPVLRRQN